MREHHSLHMYIFVLFAGIALFSISIAWMSSMRTSVGHSYEVLFMANPVLKSEKPDPVEAKGIYLTAYSAANPTKRAQMIELMNATELNTVVIDIKDYTGYVLYDTQVALANELGLKRDRLGDVSEIIKDFHANNIYVMARQTVFQDPVLAEKRPDLAFKATWGGLWRDHKGLAWVDASKPEIWNYNIAIAKEAIALGFDEINFDYVRFPTDGNMSALVYTHGEKQKHDVMGEFFAYLSEALRNEPAYISLDFFGFVMERHDGMTIGQRLEDAVDHVDYIAPMMYPSHYPSGHLGLANPAEHPGIVIENGMQKGAPYFEDKRAAARPWIQAFNIGAVYDAAKVRAQIDAVEAYTDGGWLLWNASNRYNAAGLKAN